MYSVLTYTKSATTTLFTTEGNADRNENCYAYRLHAVSADVFVMNQINLLQLAVTTPPR
jgi:hypothetical protein